MTTIGVHDLEAGDLILAASASSPAAAASGWVLRQMTPTEVEGYTSDGSLGVWVLPAMLGGPTAVVVSPNEQVVLAVIKSHKTVADDLGPAVGLADAT
jgi:hypothetical protein